jgi:hypothetical protein
MSFALRIEKVQDIMTKWLVSMFRLVTLFLTLKLSQKARNSLVVSFFF